MMTSESKEVKTKSKFPVLNRYIFPREGVAIEAKTLQEAEKKLLTKNKK